ncbi:MAG: metallopeptidase TldD-related protein [Terriglobia bacterium]
MTGKLTKLISALVLALAILVSAQGDPQSPAPTLEDPILRAMKIELERSKSQLKLEQMAAPYYIDYRIVDLEERIGEAAYGALRSGLHMRFRFLRVVVRVGDYKQDSYFGQGEGVSDLAPLDNDELALRHHLWLATDRAYKAATESLAAKQAQLKQMKIDQPVDDFAHADPVQHLEPLAKLDADVSPWLKTLQDVTALYKTDPQVQSMTSAIEFQAANRYFVNTEGSIVRTGQTSYQVRMAASAQAADGMQLQQSAGYAASDLSNLPTADNLLGRGKEMVGALKALRAAPLADEEYRGPVLFSNHAAGIVFADLVGENIRGRRPNLGQPARTRGAFASSYKNRVLPEFLSVVDDPTLASYEGKPLLGHYEVDDEGVKAARVLAIENGKLVNYLLGRQPIRDFPESNGHGRARSANAPPEPSLGNLIVTASETVPHAEMKKKLLELCQQRDQPYGYYVESLSDLRDPHMLYRVWAKDGHEELVRGAVFEDLDVRSLRNDLIAAGDDMYVANRTQNIPHSVVSPSILFDELGVKREDKNKSTLPEYPPPPLTPAE